MRLLTSSILSLALVLLVLADDKPSNTTIERTDMQTDIQSVAPALDKYRDDVIVGDLWKRPDLSLRDRSIVTLAILIVRNQPELK